MTNLFSPPALLGLGAAILFTGAITLGLRALGLPREVALYIALCIAVGSITLCYGYLQRRG